MSQSKPALEENILALMRNHGSEKRNTVKSRKTKNEKQKSQKSKTSKNSKMSKMSKKSETRVLKNRDKRPMYNGDDDKDLEHIIDPSWAIPGSRSEYLLDPKTGRYYDIHTTRLSAYTKPNGKVVVLKW